MQNFQHLFCKYSFSPQIPKIQDNAFDIKSNHDPVLAAINMFQNHPNVINIKQKIDKIIKNVNVRKTCQGSDIPTKIIKLNVDLFSSFICQNFNYCRSIGKFPNELKYADVIPIHKKG